MIVNFLAFISGYSFLQKCTQSGAFGQSQITRFKDVGTSGSVAEA